MPLMPGVQVKDYVEALVDGFDEDELKRLLRTRLNKKLDVIVGPGPLQDRAFDLVEKAEQQGWHTQLLQAAYHENPGNSLLAEVYGKYGLAPQITFHGPEGAVDAVATWAVQGDGFEKTVHKHIPTVDILVWREKIAAVEGWVCRIESDGNPMGTGFLVGQDLVLTNYHVVESVLTRNPDPSTIRCRFDYKRLSNGAFQQGREVKLGTPWHQDLSPYSANEKAGHPDRAPLPSSNELDYALLRLAEPVGNQPLLPGGGEEAPKRHWLRPQPGLPPLAEKTPLLIAQHPLGAPMQLAVDTQGVIGRNTEETRVRYSTNTLNGSSGSPCFDMHWNLVALHHYGDPAYGHDPAWNQGIPIQAILDRLRRNGIQLS